MDDYLRGLEDALQACRQRAEMWEKHPEYYYSVCAYAHEARACEAAIMDLRAKTVEAGRAALVQYREKK